MEKNTKKNKTTLQHFDFWQQFDFNWRQRTDQVLSLKMANHFITVSDELS